MPDLRLLFCPLMQVNKKVMQMFEKAEQVGPPSLESAGPSPLVWQGMLLLDCLLFHGVLACVDLIQVLA